MRTHQRVLGIALEGAARADLAAVSQEPDVVVEGELEARAVADSIGQQVPSTVSDLNSG